MAFADQLQTGGNMGRAGNPNFTPHEDAAIAEAYKLVVLETNPSSEEMNAELFWTAVGARVAPPSARQWKALHSRFTRKIAPAVSAFVRHLGRALADNRLSAWNWAQYFNVAMHTFNIEHKQPFKFARCFHSLKLLPGFALPHNVLPARLREDFIHDTNIETKQEPPAPPLKQEGSAGPGSQEKVRRRHSTQSAHNGQKRARTTAPAAHSGVQVANNQGDPQVDAAAPVHSFSGHAPRRQHSSGASSQAIQSASAASGAASVVEAALRAHMQNPDLAVAQALNTVPPTALPASDGVGSDHQHNIAAMVDQLQRSAMAGTAAAPAARILRTVSRLNGPGLSSIPPTAMAAAAPALDGSNGAILERINQALEENRALLQDQIGFLLFQAMPDTPNAMEFMALKAEEYTIKARERLERLKRATGRSVDGHAGGEHGDRVP